MSKIGEIADGILELLNKERKISLGELEKKVPLDLAVLSLMKDCGLIEMKQEEVRITGFGLDLLNLK